MTASIVGHATRTGADSLQSDDQLRATPASLLVAGAGLSTTISSVVQMMVLISRSKEDRSECRRRPASVPVLGFLITT